MRKVQGCCDPVVLPVKGIQLPREKLSRDPAEGFIPGYKRCWSLLVAGPSPLPCRGNFFKEEDEVVLHRSLAFPDKPGEFLVGRNGIHVPLCNVQADDDAGDVSNRIPDAVI